MEREIPVITVTLKGTTDMATINEADFDPALHEKQAATKAEPKATKPEAAPVAEPDSK